MRRGADFGAAASRFELVGLVPILPAFRRNRRRLRDRTLNVGPDGPLSRQGERVWPGRLGQPAGQPAKTERLQVDRTEKSGFVAAMHGAFKDAGAIVVASYAGLTVSEISAFRARVRKAGGSVKVAKNRLAKIALKGTKAEPIAGLFKGQTLVCYSGDPVAAPKAAVDFAKTNDKLVILGGAMGAASLDEKGVKALASLPSLDELRGKLVGMIATPATRIARLLNAPAGQVARVIGAYARKSDAA